jgi:hypothetical protein
MGEGDLNFLQREKFNGRENDKEKIKRNEN